MKYFTVIAILGAVLFLNMPETWPEVTQNTEIAAEVVSKEVLDKTLPIVYTTAQDLYARGTPMVIKVNGETVQVIGLAYDPPVDTTDSLSLTHGNSLTASQWDAIVASYNPAIIDTGKDAVAFGDATGIDNAYVLAMWIKESTVGLYGSAAETNNTGNIICAGYPTCEGRFRSYPTWTDGLRDHFELLRCYRDSGCNGLWTGKTHATIAEAIDTWAPPVENDTNAYRDFVITTVQEWRSANKTIAPEESQFVPKGHPLGFDAPITQGYDVGTHAPAATWGGLDFAAPEGTPIYATHSGIVVIVPESWPAGNYLANTNEHYKTAYAHLSRYTVINGQSVKRGDLIGYVGSTGQATGPHLHYEVWKDGVNINPTAYLK